MQSRGPLGPGKFHVVVLVGNGFHSLALLNDSNEQRVSEDWKQQQDTVKEHFNFFAYSGVALERFAAVFVKNRGAIQTPKRNIRRWWLVSPPCLRHSSVSHFFSVLWLGPKYSTQCWVKLLCFKLNYITTSNADSFSFTYYGSCSNSVKLYIFLNIFYVCVSFF